MMLFAIVFGLSMDYEVFLLSRIREEYDRTGDNATRRRRRPRRHGPRHHRRGGDHGAACSARSSSATTARSSCSASAWPSRSLIDATIVRLVLVPATMELLGDRNWWIPKWLDRILPVVHVEPAEDLDAELRQLSEEEQTAAGRR